MYEEIRADYDQLEQVANQFANQSQAIQQMAQNIRSSMDPLEGGGWIGRGSDAFFAEMQSDVIPASERLQQALDEANRVTKQIVQIVKQAEDDASSPFRLF